MKKQLCDSCHESLVTVPPRRLSDSLESPFESSSDPTVMTPIIVTFVSPPLGVTLRSGEDNTNALLVRITRIDNNDNGMKVPTGSAILRINDKVVMGMDYPSIVNSIKKVSFPVTLTFGVLTASMKHNLINLLCPSCRALSLVAITKEQYNRCNYPRCMESFSDDSARECVICERLYCKNHCSRLLFVEDKPSYVCEFCFPYVFQPFASGYPRCLSQRSSSLEQWIPDYLISHCMEPGCNVEFSTIRHPMRQRRHHCRLCGNIFCDRHCNHRVVLTEIGIMVGVRVCTNCYAL